MLNRGGAAIVAGAVLGLSCAGSDARIEWRGTIDTTAAGTVVVSNPAQGIWDSASPWRIVEELRIGTAEGGGPDLFGNVGAIEVDGLGRLWVAETQAQELRVFDRQGRHLRTVGRRGGGPGEFRGINAIVWGPDGNLWVVDPPNNRISVIDTAGTVVTSRPTIGNMVISPWPGGVDSAGYIYGFAPDPDREGIVLVRYDATMRALDTIPVPRRTERDAGFFEIRSNQGYVRASVPYTSRLIWRLVWPGYIWFGETGEYRLYQRSLAGDTLRIVSKRFEPLPVTASDIDSAIERLEWFTRQGGRVDRSKFPAVKPAWEAIYADDERNLWVVPVLPRTGSRSGALAFDVFDPDGRYLGRVAVPFALAQYPPPVIRHGLIYGVAHDDLEVPYVVRARVERPSLK